MSQDESLIDRLLKEKTNRPATATVGGVEEWYKSTYNKPLPVAALGTGPAHRRMGWEHSRSFDVGLSPKSVEGTALIKYLSSQGIPFIASYGPSKSGGLTTSTGEHIHVGPPSSQSSRQSLVDRLLAEKGTSTSTSNINTSGNVPRETPDTPQNRRGAYMARSNEARYPERNPALHKLARDIEWHFGASILQQMSMLPEEQQRTIAMEATRLAGEDDVKKKRGEPIVESLAWKQSNQARVGVKGDRIRDRAQMVMREFTPEKLEEQRRAAIALDNPILKSQGAMRWLKDVGALGTAGLLDLAAGVSKLPGRAGGVGPVATGGQAVADVLHGQSEQLRGVSAEANEARPMGWKGRISRDVAAGLVEFSPLLLIPELGIESVMARIGLSAAKGAAYTGTQAYGRNESGRDIAKTAAVGGATFGLLGVPLPGKTHLRKAVSDLVIVGGGVTAINMASGQPLSEAATQGLVMSLLKAPELARKIRVSEGTGDLSPSEIRMLLESKQPLTASMRQRLEAGLAKTRPATVQDILNLINEPTKRLRLGSGKFDIETVATELPSAMTVPARGVGRRFIPERGQQELWAGLVEPAQGQRVGVGELPGHFPPAMTFEQFAQTRGIDLTNPSNLPMTRIHIRLEPLYQAYREAHKRGAGRSGEGVVTEPVVGKAVLDYGTFLQGFMGWVQQQGVDPMRLAEHPKLMKQAADAFVYMVAPNLDQTRTIAATYKFQPRQVVVPIPGEPGASVPVYSGERAQRPLDPTTGDPTLRAVASLSPEQQSYKLAELYQERNNKATSKARRTVVDRQITYLEGIVENLPTGPETGVMRMSESTARDNLATLRALKNDKITWGKLKRTQKAAIEAQIKRLSEQGAEGLGEVPAGATAPRGPRIGTTREQLDPNKARLFARERKGEAGMLNIGDIAKALDELRRKFPNLSDIELRAMLEKEHGTRDVWYDKQSRNWVTQYKDVQGNQIGEAEYSAQRPALSMEIEGKDASTTLPRMKKTADFEMDGTYDVTIEGVTYKMHNDTSLGLGKTWFLTRDSPGYIKGTSKSTGGHDEVFKNNLGYNKKEALTELVRRHNEAKQAEPLNLQLPPSYTMETRAVPGFGNRLDIKGEGIQHINAKLSPASISDFFITREAEQSGMGNRIIGDIIGRFKSEGEATFKATPRDPQLTRLLEQATERGLISPMGPGEWRIAGTSLVDAMVARKATDRRGPQRKPQASWLDMTEVERAEFIKQFNFDEAMRTGDMSKIREVLKAQEAPPPEKALPRPRPTKSIAGMGTPGTKTKSTQPRVPTTPTGSLEEIGKGSSQVTLPEPPTVDAQGRKVFKVGQPQTSAASHDFKAPQQELRTRAESILAQDPKNQLALAVLGYLDTAAKLMGQGPAHNAKVAASQARARSLLDSIDGGGIVEMHSGFDPRPGLRKLRDKFPELTDVELRAMAQQGEKLRAAQLKYRESIAKPGASLRAESKLGIEERHAGFNPAAAIKAADKLERPGFTIDKGAKADNSFGFFDRFITPLSNLDWVGTYERLAGPLGKQASDIIRRAQVNISENTFHWEKRIGEIGANLEAARGSVPKKQFYREFIELLEKPFGDRTRTHASQQIREALKLHDEIAAEWRKYIIDSRRELGIEMPDNWGITDRGYIRHLFLGDIRMYETVNGVSHFIGMAETYAKAQKIAMERIKANPNADIHAQAVQNFTGDATVRLSTRKFWRTVNELLRSTRATQQSAGGRVTLTKADILEDVHGIIGEQASKTKPFGALLKRQGFEGASQDYMHIMETHAGQLARTQELSKLNRELTPIIEQVKGQGMINLANEMKLHLDDLWGTPRPSELYIGSSIRNTPILRNYVKNPDFALRSTARFLASVQTSLRLDYNLRASMVNMLDPLATLWPYLTSKEYAGLYAEWAKPATRTRLRDIGVLQGSSKFAEGVAQHGKKTFSQRVADVSSAEGIKEKGKALLNVPPKPFRAASDVNRGVGYLAGELIGRRQGLTGDALHRHALDWARKVEFDNSIWNVAPILRSPAGRVIGQFKGYPLKAVENIHTLSKKRPGDTIFTMGTRQAKFLGSRLAIGGTKALVPGPVRLAVGAATSALGYGIVQTLSDQLQNNFGMEKDDADSAAQAVYYGAPALIGQDLSASVAIFDDLYGKSPEEKLVNYLGGPTVGMAFGVGKAIAAENPEKLATAVTPYARSVNSAMEYADRGKVSVPISRGERMELTDFEAVMRILGFTPVRQSIHFDKPPKKEMKDKLTERLRGGDTGAIKDALDEMQSGELTEKDVREVVSQAKGSELQNSFKRLTLSQAEYIYSGMTEAQQQEVLPWLLLKRKNKGVQTEQ